MDWHIPDRLRNILGRRRDTADSSPTAQPDERVIAEEVTVLTAAEVIARNEGRSRKTGGVPISEAETSVTRIPSLSERWSYKAGKGVKAVRDAYDGSGLQQVLNYDLMNIPRGVGKGISKGFGWAAGGIGAGLGAAGGGIGKGYNNFREWGGRGNSYTLKNWHKAGLFVGGLGAVGGGVVVIDYILGLKDEVQQAHADADYAQEALARVMQAIDGVAIELGEPFPRDNDYGLDAADFVGSLPPSGSARGSFRYFGKGAADLSDELLEEEGLSFGVGTPTLAGTGMDLPEHQIGDSRGVAVGGRAGVEHLNLIVDLRDYGQKTLGELIEEVIDCREGAGLYSPGVEGMPSAAECANTLVNVRTPDGVLQLTLGDLLGQYRDLLGRQHGQQQEAAAGDGIPDQGTYVERSMLTVADCADVPVDKDRTIGDVIAAENPAAENPLYNAPPVGKEKPTEAECRAAYPCLSGEGSQLLPGLSEAGQGATRVGEEGIPIEGDQQDQADGRDDAEDDFELGNIEHDTCSYWGLHGPEPGRTLEDACAMASCDNAVSTADKRGYDRGLAEGKASVPKPTTCGDGNYGGPDPSRTLEAACSYDAPERTPILPGQGAATAVGAAATPGQGDATSPKDDEDDGRLCLDGPLQNSWYNAIETIRGLPQDEQIAGFARLYGRILPAVTVEGARVFTRRQLYDELAGQVGEHPKLYGVGPGDVTANRSFFEQKMEELRGYGAGKTFLVGQGGVLEGVDGLLIQREKQ